MPLCDPGLNPLDHMNRAALLQAGFTEATVESSVGRQTCFAAGSGERLALLHGAGDHAGSWLKAAPALTGHYRVLVPDMAGRGASEPLHKPVTMEAMLAGLDAVLAGDDRLILVGNSLGAWAAMAWATARPDRVSRVVAVNGGPLRGLRPGLTLTPADRDEARRLWQSMLDPANHSIPDLMLDELIRKGRVGALSRMRWEDFHGHLMEGRLGEIAAPVDLLWGASDQLVPLAHAENMLRGFRAARLTLIPGCGHMPHLEKADRFNAALAGVLESLP